MIAPILDVRNIKKHFPVGSQTWLGSKQRVYAVDGVSFSIARGETLSLVGESGCGKSTVGKAILRLFDLTDGEIYLDGQRIDQMPASSLRPLRKNMQVIFQDPYSSLNPRLRVSDIVAEPLVCFGVVSGRKDLDREVASLLEKVGLPRESAERWPHEFSGGQRQRICIARALAAKPELIVCDEAVSALDVSVKAQIINLLADLQRDLGLALLFISHDLAIVEHMTHRVAVMYLGRVVEIGTRDEIFHAPHHPYTQALLSAVPVPDVSERRQRIQLKGEVPSPLNPPSGCHFHTRCAHATERCALETPVFRDLSLSHRAACHLLDG